MKKAITLFLFLLNCKIYSLTDTHRCVKYVYIFLDNIKYKIKVPYFVNIASAENLTF